MKTCRSPSLLLSMLTLPLAFAALPACGSRSSSTGEVVVAQQTIGPDGGVLLVETGAQKGLTMIVPPQALLEPVRFVVVDESPALPPELRALSYSAMPGLPFRIEPDDVFTREDVTIRMPYRLSQMQGHAPGNVFVEQRSAFLPIDHEPDEVDVVEGMVQIRTREFGTFVVRLGPSVDDVLDYLPTTQFVTFFENGYDFQILSAPDSLFGPGVDQWRIQGPGFDESLFFRGRLIVGRETTSFRETWTEDFDPWQRVEDVGLQVTNMQTIVDEPVGALISGVGLLSVYGYRQFDEPIEHNGLQLDVVKLIVDMTSDLPINGFTQRQFTFWFAPGQGLLRLGVDGQVSERQ